MFVNNKTELISLMEEVLKNQSVRYDNTPSQDQTTLALETQGDNGRYFNFYSISDYFVKSTTIVADNISAANKGELLEVLNDINSVMNFGKFIYNSKMNDVSYVYCFFINNTYPIKTNTITDLIELSLEIPDKHYKEIAGVLV